MTGRTSTEYLGADEYNGPSGPPGPPGPAGTPGTPGTPGANGATWYEGSGAPNPLAGVNNDLYLDLVTGNVYVKTAGAWGIVGNIKGPAGTSSPNPYVFAAFNNNPGSFSDPVVWGTTSTNVGSAFNGTRFTAALAGQYAFAFKVDFVANASSSATVKLSRYNSGGVLQEQQSSQISSATTSNKICAVIPWIFTMSLGDYVTAGMTLDSGSVVPWDMNLYGCSCFGQQGPAGTPGGLSNAALWTIDLAACSSSPGIPGINNGGGSVCGTLVQAPSDMTIGFLSTFVKQAGGNNFRLAVYNTSGNLLAYTGLIGGTPGLVKTAITNNGAGGSISSLALTGGQGYYLAIWGSNAGNAAQFLGRDNGTTWGATPYVASVKDNSASIPASGLNVNETQYRFYVEGSAT